MDSRSTFTMNRITESLNGLNFHNSPPPTLTARLDDDQSGQEPRASRLALSNTQESGSSEVEKRRSLPPLDDDPEGAINAFVENLLNPDHADSQPHLMAIGYELEALLSIYSPSSVKLCHAATSTHQTDVKEASVEMSSRGSKEWLDALRDYNSGLIPNERIRYEVVIPAWESGDSLPGIHDQDLPRNVPEMRVLVSLPPTYPNSSPPQLQLLGRYLGNFPIDAGLFGDITRTYISSSGVGFIPGDVCVFEGLTHVQNLARDWYAKNLSSDIEADKSRRPERIEQGDITHSRPSPSRATFSYSSSSPDDPTIPQTVKDAQRDLKPTFEITSSEPIVERRSTFVGHAVRVTDEREVPLVVYQLLEDKKIAKAHHPAIFAYRIAKEVGGAAGKAYSSDHDDDGESQAGARLQHLLDILELENVLVVVTRWYGGTLLGADRFKYINQVARDALELGGFLDEKEKGVKGKGKKR